VAKASEDCVKLGGAAASSPDTANAIFKQVLSAGNDLLSSLPGVGVELIRQEQLGRARGAAVAARELAVVALLGIVVIFAAADVGNQLQCLVHQFSVRTQNLHIHKKIIRTPRLSFFQAKPPCPAACLALAAAMSMVNLGCWLALALREKCGDSITEEEFPLWDVGRVRRPGAQAMSIGCTQANRSAPERLSGGWGTELVPPGQFQILATSLAYRPRRGAK
jgi:hypothetical protein